MLDFFRTMGGYFAPYKKFVVLTFLFNVLTAIFNVFSFGVLVPILSILFKVKQEHYELVS